MRLSLKSFGSWQAVEEVVIEQFPFVLGRDKECNCSLPFAFVSRRHCAFSLQRDVVVLQDLDSYNGTHLNGHRLTEPRGVNHGDEISLGPLSFRIAFASGMPDTAFDCNLPATLEIPPEAMEPAANQPKSVALATE